VLRVAVEIFPHLEKTLFVLYGIKISNNSQLSLLMPSQNYTSSTFTILSSQYHNPGNNNLEAQEVTWTL